MTEKNVPKIRFPGFSDPWEQRKFGDIFKEYSVKNCQNLPALTIVQGTGTVERDQMDRQLNYDKANLKGYKLVNPGDFIVHLRSFEGGLEKANSKGIVSPAYHVFHGAGIDYRFYYPFFRSDYFVKHLLKPCVYGIRDGRSISIPELEHVYIPYTTIEEQRKIGDFIDAIDDSITLHQRKLDDLKSLKSGLLQKMFPKPGTAFPEVRFPEFTDPWEQRKVSEILKERNEQAPESHEYPLMAFIANEGVAPKGDRYDRGALVRDSVNKKYKKTEFGDFIYSSNNLESGSIGLNRYGKASISPVYSIFSPINNADSNFIGERLSRRDFINQMIKSRQGVLYGQWRIHESEFLKLNILVPTVAEQQKIGRFSSLIDEAITLHQRKLENLKLLKQGLLQQMFV